MMSSSTKKGIRLGFNNVKDILSIGSLLEYQISTYTEFFQPDKNPCEREDKGLESILRSSFPVSDSQGKILVEYVDYEFANSDFTPEECIDAGLSYLCNIKAKFIAKVFSIDADTGEKVFMDAREQVIQFAEVPMITDSGSFIVNGIERSAVCQIQRSPGVTFSKETTDVNGYLEDSIVGRIALSKGPWLDFEFDSKGSIRVKVDKTKKVNVAALLMSLYKNESYFEKAKVGGTGVYDLGYTTAEMLAIMYKVHDLDIKGGLFISNFEKEYFLNKKLNFDILDKKGEVAIPAGTRISNGLIKKLKIADTPFAISKESLIGKYIANDCVQDDGVIVIEAGGKITEDNIDAILSLLSDKISILDMDVRNTDFCIRDAIVSNPSVYDRQSALVEVYKSLKGVSSDIDVESAEEFLFCNFFNPVYCSLSEVGRQKANQRLGLNETRLSYTAMDIIMSIKQLVDLQSGIGEMDDIDSLHNRRVRSIAEILDGIYRSSIARSYRYIRDRASSLNVNTLVPSDLLNFKHLSNTVKDFFHSSQLCQFLDNTNPLTSLTHKRRISAFGPGGVSRERAGFEIRDVHTTYYGKICPIETPEGQTIGLINSPATHTRFNRHGFLEAPYRKVRNGVVTDEVVYLSALDENKHIIAQFTRNIDENNKMTDEKISARVNGDYKTVDVSTVDFMDASPNQTVSIAASLIPFLEKNDANRALMGSNMQRQAVPLLKPEAPIVGTGTEAPIAFSGSEITLAKRGGKVEYVDSTRIVISSADEKGVIDIDNYYIKKYRRSNQNTCLSQMPIVKVGDIVEKGDVLTDSSSVRNGELAIGKNVLCAFMPWYGYNFEDSILMSERLLVEGVFTSIHIEELEAVALDTKLGPEEITKDIPTANAIGIGNLDESGIVISGANVVPGDILVGKVTPKGGETGLIAEERLLRAMFGEKARSVKDTSLRVPSGVYGTVIDVRAISYSDTDMDYRSYMVHEEMIENFAKDLEQSIDSMKKSFKSVIAQSIAGKKTSDGKELSYDSVMSMKMEQIEKIKFEKEMDGFAVSLSLKNLEESINRVTKSSEDRIEKLKRGVELAPNLLKVVKVFIAVKRRLQSGDKISGRHGNKGVISRIISAEDMPYLEDGTPIDVVLNTLGVPSRMNIGQVFEAHLGWASKKLGEKISRMVSSSYNESTINAERKQVMELLGSVFKKRNMEDIVKMRDVEFHRFCKESYDGIRVASAVFDGATNEDIDKMLKAADTSAQVTLIDGRNGEKFERPITVGYSYLLKLDHLVDDKIHARSVGKYSLVTQQPLGGRAQFGGQRLGEMEVWALQAYGASYTLHEMLTIKSDDSEGRVLAYDSIIRGQDNFLSRTPESFNVLIRELKALGINVELIQDSELTAN